MNTIGVVALGPVDPPMLMAVAEEVARAFRHPVSVLDPEPDPAFAYDERRGQYSSVLVLRSLLERIPASTLRLLGVTGRDLFIPMLSFVLGQAQLNGRVAVISLARLEQQFYGFPPDPEVLRVRAIKEAVHEIGHTFGLTHCGDIRCPMSLSNTIQHVDLKGSALCPACALLFHEHAVQSRAGSDPAGAAG